MVPLIGENDLVDIPRLLAYRRISFFNSASKHE